MEKTYKHIAFLFIAIFFILVWGFYKTYIIYFPNFKGFNYIQHVHGFLMLIWVSFLICQPLLIKARNYKAHRIIGKISYIIVPLLLFSIFLVTRMVYYRTLSTDSEREAIASITVSIPDLVSFAIFYTLAILNKENIKKHMRYMIGTSVLLISPGLGRALAIFFNMPVSYALAIPDYIAMLIVLIFITYDFRNKKLLSLRCYPFSTNCETFSLGMPIHRFLAGYWWTICKTFIINYAQCN